MIASRRRTYAPEDVVFIIVLAVVAALAATLASTAPATATTEPAVTIEREGHGHRHRDRVLARLRARRGLGGALQRREHRARKPSPGRHRRSAHAGAAGRDRRERVSASFEDAWLVPVQGRRDEPCPGKGLVQRLLRHAGGRCRSSSWGAAVLSVFVACVERSVRGDRSARRAPSRGVADAERRPRRDAVGAALADHRPHGRDASARVVVPRRAADGRRRSACSPRRPSSHGGDRLRPGRQVERLRARS